jgi:hypothetical protein
MALDVLALQVEMADEDALFKVGVAAKDGGVRGVFESLVPCDAWSGCGGFDGVRHTPRITGRWRGCRNRRGRCAARRRPH